MTQPARNSREESVGASEADASPLTSHSTRPRDGQGGLIPSALLSRGRLRGGNEGTLTSPKGRSGRFSLMVKLGIGKTHHNPPPFPSRTNLRLSGGRSRRDTYVIDADPPPVTRTAKLTPRLPGLNAAYAGQTALNLVRRARSSHSPLPRAIRHTRSGTPKQTDGICLSSHSKHV